MTSPRRPGGKPARKTTTRAGERRGGEKRRAPVPRGRADASRQAARRSDAPRESFRPRKGLAPRDRGERPLRGGDATARKRPSRAPRERFGPREDGAPRGRFQPPGRYTPRERAERPGRSGGITPRPRPARPTREQSVSRRRFVPREQVRPHDDLRPREGYKPREGHKPRQGYKPREGFRPRGDFKPREGDKARGDFKPREGYKPREGFKPREGHKPREGFKPRGDFKPREGYKPREGFKPREGYKPRGDFKPRGGFKPREEVLPREGDARPPYARPRANRTRAERPRADRPRADRPLPERPRFERPRFERPREDRPREVRVPAHDEGGDQSGAVNRSRPIYPQGPAVRWRRDGKPSPPAASWRGPRADERAGHRNGPPFRRDDRRGTGVADTARDARRAVPAAGPDAPSLPADPREAALRILHAVDTRSAFSDRLLDGAHARPGADPRDRALLHELVKGTLRWRGRLDAALDPRVHVGLANTQPWIRNILRLGAYQLLFLDRVPIHAAVDESVKLAHKYAHPGAAGLVNSVLRRLAEERGTLAWPEGDDAPSLAAWGSHPLWMVERWLARFGPAGTRALLVADNRTVPTGLRANTLRNSRGQLVEMLSREGVEARPATLSPDLVWVEGHHSPGALHCFREGLCTAQDESEALVGRVVAPQPHERVLDLCAAPGGKSSHLAELMGDEGEVWAMERDAHRVDTLRATLARLGMHSVHVVHGDGRTYQFPMPFDRVLVDAPCSGMGVLARRADARWRKGPEVLAEMPPVQLDLLRSAARHLSRGGLLVYSVCTFEPEETDHVVARFLGEHPGWVVESAAGSVPDAVVTEEGSMRVLPHVHGCDGAFAVRLRKP